MPNSDTEDPMRLTLRNEIDAPKVKKSRTARADPQRASPKREIAELSRSTARIDKHEPKCVKSSTDKEDPILPMPKSDRLLPK